MFIQMENILNTYCELLTRLKSYGQMKCDLLHLFPQDVSLWLSL